MRIVRRTDEAPGVHTIEINSRGDGRSGQFFMVSVPGVGEAPISVASGFGRNMLFTIRNVGSVTSHMNKIDTMGVRGPYGTKWPWKEYEEILAVTGGIGIPPVRSLIEEINDSGKGRKLEVLYGAKTPEDIIYKTEIERWMKKVNVHLTVDSGDENWTGRVGLVTSIMKDAEVSKSAGVFIVGPPLMMKNVVKEALNLGYREENIFLSLERRMECGIGVCGHCNVGEFYSCEDGPIFNYHKVKHQKELFL